MRELTPLLLIPVAFAGIAATTYTITQLTSNPSPSDGTLLEIYDPSASPKSGKYLLTNLVKKSEMLSVWTNNDGAITPSSGQSTNQLVFVSGIEDNPTNEAFIINTKTPFTDGYLFTAKNASSNVFVVGSYGGDSTIVDIRPPNYDYTGFDQSPSVSFRLSPTTVYMDYQVGAGGPSGYSEVDFALNSENAENNFWDFTCNFESHYGGTFLHPFNSDNIQFRFEGGITNGSSFPSAAFRNMGTNLFTVGLDGTITSTAAVVTNNVSTALSGGNVDYVDVLKASQTNSISGALTLAHATNGAAGLSYTHARWFFNGSGADRTVTIPSGWKTNVNINWTGARQFTVTNGTVARMLVACLGPTGSAALQTNTYMSLEHYK